MPLQVIDMLFFSSTRLKKLSLFMAFCFFAYVGNSMACHPRPVREFVGHSDFVSPVCFSPNGLLALSGGGSFDNTVRLWDIQNGEEIRQFKSAKEGTNPDVRVVAFSPDGKRLLASGQGRPLSVWEVETGKELHSLSEPNRGVSLAGFSPDGRKAFALDLLDRLTLWDLQTGNSVNNSQFADIEGLVFSPDGKKLVIVDFANITLWDVEGWKTIRRLKKNHNRRVLRLEFSADGKQMLCWDWDKAACELRLWDAETDKEIKRFSGTGGQVHRVVVCPRGKRFMSWSAGGALRLWDIDSGKIIWQVSGQTNPRQRNPSIIPSIAISRDGRFALTTSDKIIRLWELPK